MEQEMKDTDSAVADEFKGKSNIDIKTLNVIDKSNQTDNSLNKCLLKYYHDENNTKIFEFIDESKCMQRIILMYFQMAFIDRHMNIKIMDPDEKITFVIELNFMTEDDCTACVNWLKLKKTKIDTEFDKLIEQSYTINLRINPKIGFDSTTYLFEKVENLINKYHSGSYHGPYTTLCQSSGFGKSRACTSLAEKECFVVYCCLRKENSTGYPKRSCLAGEYFLVNDADIEKYFKCYFNAFIDFLNDSETAIEPISCKYFFEHYDQQKKDSPAKKLVADKIKSSNGKIEISNYKRTKPLIFVFDESSSLLEISTNKKANFFILRSLLSQLKGRVFVLFLDTFTHLSEFMPSRYADPSARIANEGSSTIEPIYLLPNWDVFVDYGNIQNMKDTVKFENICMFGRALWGSLLETRKNSQGIFKVVDPTKLYDLAAQKLIGGKNTTSNYDMNDCLAILSSRICSIKSKCLSTSQDLVARHMAVCLFVNANKNLFEIDYPSEPILADAAALLMNDIKTYDLMVDNLILAIESSIVSRGNKGELIAKLILLLAKDRCMNPTKSNSILKFTFLTTVGEFVQSIYGKCSDKCGNIENQWKCGEEKDNCCITIIRRQLKNSTELLNGLINFTHFVKPKEMMEKTSLKSWLKRCAAIHCKSCQNGIDLVIPVCFNNKNFQSLSAIMVQVKLYTEPKIPSFKSAFKSIDQDFISGWDCTKPFLLLYMQLGSPKNNADPFLKYLKPSKNANKAMIYSEGFSRSLFPQLSETLEEKLKGFMFKDQNLHKSDKRDEITFEAIRFCLDCKTD